MVVLADKSDAAQQAKTEITHQRAEYVRANMDKSLDKLQDETGLSEYVIETIIEAKQNGFYHQPARCITKYERLTDEMKDYILTTEFDHWINLKKKFNHHFRMSDLTPMGQKTLKKYYNKLQEEGPSKNS